MMSRAASSFSSSTSERADRHAERLEERVGHRAADDQAIDAAEQALDHLDLVRHLGAAEDRRRTAAPDRRAPCRDRSAPSPSAARRRPAEVAAPSPHRRVRAMRRAERVVDIDLGERGQRCRRTPASFFSSSAWKRRFSSSTMLDPAGAFACADRFARRLADAVAGKDHRSRPSSRRQVIGHRLQAELGRRLSLRPPEVRGQHHRGARLERIRNRRQRRA